MRLTLNYSVSTVISAITNLCDKNTFTHNLTKIDLSQPKVHIWMEFFEIKNFSIYA